MYIVETHIPDPHTDAKALLDAANSASEKVAAFHIAFLAVCTYVAVIAFSTTDMDLLIGKGVKLPVVDVAVPIVGFYATAPYLLVLFHFNLLLQLQLLSRKLYAFDGAASHQEGIGGLRDRLNIFPYNYYLVGQLSRPMAFFVALLVTITILLLPLAVLLTLQARFLAYQSETFTWVQRVATWIDVGVVTVLWPIIMHRGDSWNAFVKRVWDNVNQYRLRWALRFAGFALSVTFFLASAWEYGEWVFWTLVMWLLLTLSEPAWRRAIRWLSCGRYSIDWQPTPLARGATGLLVLLLFGLPLPLMFLVDGEALDSPDKVCTKILTSLHLRNLDLQGEVLLAKPVRPETIADLRSTDYATRTAAQRLIEPINLRERSLRGAYLNFTVMPMANLTFAQLQGANLEHAQLQGAHLAYAELQAAYLRDAQLQGANLEYAQLQGANFEDAQLQGANLERAQLQGTNLERARLQGANLELGNLGAANLQRAQLQAANLTFAQLHGARLIRAQLQGADLRHSQLQATDLRGAQLQAADLRGALLYTNLMPSTIELVDVRGLKWLALTAKEMETLNKIAADVTWLVPDAFLKTLGAATARGLKAPTIESCLEDVNTEIICKKTFDRDKFREEVFKELEAQACQSSYLAHGILARLSRSFREDFVTVGLAARLRDIRKNGTSKNWCPGLFLITDYDTELLTKLAHPEER